MRVFAVREWIKPTMEEYGTIYTAYEWHTVMPEGRVIDAQSRGAARAQS